MILAVALAAAFAAGVDIRRIALLAIVVSLPLVSGVLVLLHMWRARPERDNRASLFCESVAAELRSGASLRDALASAATSVESGDDDGGSSYESPVAVGEMAGVIADAFPDIAQELRLTVVSASRSGSDAADLFDEIGALAIAQSEIRHEVKVATAPAQATTLLLVGAPVAFVVNRMSSGGFGALVASAPQRLVTLLGLGLFLLGALATALILWRAGK